jgi:hypothetical protein
MKKKWPGSHFFFSKCRQHSLLPDRRASLGAAGTPGQFLASRQNKSRANPRADAAMKLLLPGAPNPEQVTPRGALRSMQRYRLHLGF